MRSFLPVAAIAGAFPALLFGLGTAIVLAWFGAPVFAWACGGFVGGVLGTALGAGVSLVLPVPRPKAAPPLPPPPPWDGVTAALGALAAGQPLPAVVDGPPEVVAALRTAATALQERRSRLERQHLDAAMALEQEQQHAQTLAGAVRAADRRLSESLSVQEAFLSRMSHELRTPLNAISGYVEMLLEEADGDLAADLNRVRLAALNLTALVTGVLDLTELQSGSYAVRPEPIQLESLLRSVMDSCRITADNQRNRLELDVAPGLTAVLDKRMTQSVLFNLVSNACKYTVGGAVQVTASRTGEPGTSEEGVRITIADTGIGMTKRQIEAAFRAFTQADETSTRRYDGSGVGLAVVKGFVEAMDGTVAIESEPGKGARVVVSLPLQAKEKVDSAFGEDEPTMLVR